ncbi:MAG TPA: hypothetical protein VG963_04340 [Polyangiaceae bacterium]|nr:hypothetical protein [Polyangiaceae bacterium]
MTAVQFSGTPIVRGPGSVSVNILFTGDFTRCGIRVDGDDGAGNLLRFNPSFDQREQSAYGWGTASPVTVTFNVVGTAAPPSSWRINAWLSDACGKTFAHAAMP